MLKLQPKAALGVELTKTQLQSGHVMRLLQIFTQMGGGDPFLHLTPSPFDCLFFNPFFTSEPSSVERPIIKGLRFDPNPNPERHVCWSGSRVLFRGSDFYWTTFLALFDGWLHSGQAQHGRNKTDRLTRKQWYDSNRAWKAQKFWLGRVM